MFKPVRDKKDRVIPKGMYKNLEQRLKERNDVKGIRTVTVYPFDRYTDLGPYVGLADRLISGGILHYTACLVNSGFTNLRAVLRQHNPKLKLSKTTFKPLTSLKVKKPTAKALPKSVKAKTYKPTKIKFNFKVPKYARLSQLGRA